MREANPQHFILTSSYYDHHPAGFFNPYFGVVNEIARNRQLIMPQASIMDQGSGDDIVGEFLALFVNRHVKVASSKMDKDFFRTTSVGIPFLDVKSLVHQPSITFTATVTAFSITFSTSYVPCSYKSNFLQCPELKN